MVRYLVRHNLRKRILYHVALIFAVMRNLLSLTIILYLASCTKPQEPAPKIEKYYDLEFRSDALQYPVQVKWTIGSQVYTGTIHAPFDTTVYHVKGGVKAGLLTYDYQGRTNRLKSVIIYEPTKSAAQLYPFNDSVWVEVNLPEYEDAVTE